MRSLQCRLDVARLRCRADARLPWLPVALPGARYQPSRLVLDLDGNLGQRFGVLAAVMGAEQQLPGVRENNAYVRLGTTPVTQVRCLQRPAWCESSGHVASLASAAGSG